jgi:hypothetical protein
MIKEWLRAAVGNRALEKSTREVTGFVEGLEAMTVRDIGVVVAVANVVRVNMENHGVLPEGLLWEGALPSAEELGEYQLQLNKLARDFARKGLGEDSAAAMVWSYSLRSLNVPYLRPLGRRLWAALERGFPHVEAALKQGETEKGEPFDNRVWEEWRKIPVGLEPE